METNSKIAASIPVCEEDKDYLDMCFAEIARMDVSVAWLANNCSEETLQKLRDFRRTVGVSVQDGYFNNCMRNYPMEILQNLDFDWMLQWDVDETWEPKAPGKLRSVLADQQMLQVRMGHVWMKDNETYITTDFSSERDRVYNLKYPWMYLSKVVAGPTCMNSPNNPTPVPVWMVHWGYSTLEKRQTHKQRWDVNHGRSVGKNPYGHWQTISQPDYEPKLTPFDEFIDKL